MKGSKENISIVATLYNSSIFLDEFVRRVYYTMGSISEEYDFEILFVDDGSPDNSAGVILELKERYSNIKLVRLSRNFGHHLAIYTGLKYCKGDWIFIIDVDLEEPPEEILSFLRIAKAKQVDFVLGVQKKREGNLSRRLISPLFYNIFNFFSDLKIIKNQVISRLISSKFKETILQYKEVDFLLAGIFSHAGFKCETMEIEKSYKGKSEYNIKKQLNQILQAITSFSAKPLRMIFYLGSLMTIVSAGLVSYVLIMNYVVGTNATGWSSLMLSLWLIGGIIIFSLGILGIYLEKVFIQVKGRPITVISELYL